MRIKKNIERPKPIAKVIKITSNDARNFIF
jgi:hypothetical protein